MRVGNLLRVVIRVRFIDLKDVIKSELILSGSPWLVERLQTHASFLNRFRPPVFSIITFSLLRTVFDLIQNLRFSFFKKLKALVAKLALSVFHEAVCMKLILALEALIDF